MINFEVTYTLDGEIHQVEQAGEHIGEVLEFATSIMRGAHDGRGQVIGIRQLGLYTAVTKDGRRLRVTVPEGK